MIEKATEYIKQFFSNDCSGHDYYHTMRVYRLATEIAKQENAVSFLRANGLEKEKIAIICKIIEEVSFAGTDSVVPGTIEGRCAQDADRLDALGAIGIARTFA